MKDLLSLPRLSVKEKGRSSGVVKCDENLLRFVKERVEQRFPNLAFTRKGAMEYALLEWLEGRDRSDLLVSSHPTPKPGEAVRACR
jgi:hypothetical protein